MKIHETASIGDVYMRGNIKIGKGTYINSGQIFSGPQTSVIIGDFCAIGYNVHIKSQSHDSKQATAISLTESHRHIEATITIGNHVWIGDNVFIKQGIKVGNNCIIGANSVVTKDVEDFTVVGGVPAKKIMKLI